MNDILIFLGTAILTWLHPLTRIDWGFAGILFGLAVFGYFGAVSHRALVQIIGSLMIGYSLVFMTDPPTLVAPDGTTPIFAHFVIWVLGILTGPLLRSLYHWKPKRTISFIR